MIRLDPVAGTSGRYPMGTLPRSVGLSKAQTAISLQGDDGEVSMSPRQSRGALGAAAPLRVGHDVPSYSRQPCPIRLTLNAFCDTVVAAGAENGLTVLLCFLRFLLEFVGRTRVETRDP